MAGTMLYTSNELDQIVCNLALDLQTNEINLFNSSRQNTSGGAEPPAEITCAGSDRRLTAASSGSPALTKTIATNWTPVGDNLLALLWFTSV